MTSFLANEKMTDATTERRICLGCRAEFVIAKEERAFFLSRFDQNGRPLELPKRCLACRRARAVARRFRP